MMRSLQAQTQPLKGSRTVPLRLVLILPFVLQISVAVGLTGWLSIQNGRKAISDLAGQLRSEVAMRIQQHLNQYLEKPYLVTQSNADASQLGHLHFDDVSAVERHFWRQKQLFGSVGAIYFGSTSGISVTVDRNQQDGFVSSVTEKFPRLGSYRLDNQGDRVEQVKVYPEYDPRTRPWYQAAVAAQKPVWSEVYPFLEGELGITQSQPFYDPAGRFQGVVAVDLFLSGFSNFLESLKISPTAKMLIVDRSGYLVATSVADQPLSISQGNDDAQLVQAIASRDPLIQATIQHLFDRYGSLERITEAQQLDFSWNGQREFVQVLPYQQSGLDWLVVAVIPEADFMAQINTNTRTTILLCCAALAIATLLGLLTSKWITQPILRLSQASETLGSVTK